MSNNAIGPRDLPRIAKALEGIGKTLERIEKQVRKPRPVIIRCKYNLNESDFERWAEKIESKNENLVCIPASAEVITDQPVKGRGVFIPDVTVEMIRNAPLEGIEELLNNGEMYNVPEPTEDNRSLPEGGGER